MYVPSSLLKHVKLKHTGTKGNGNFSLQVSVLNSLCTPYPSTLHVATVKKEVGTFKIGKFLLFLVMV